MSLVCLYLTTSLIKRSSWDFLLSFVLWSFQVLGKDLMDFGIRSGKSLSLGMTKAPQGNIQGQSRAQAWGCPGRHPLLCLRPSVTLLGAIFLFTTWYVFCLERQFILLGFACCLFRTMFFIFYFNKSGIDSLYYAYFRSPHVAVWKQKVYRCFNNSLEKSECDKMLIPFAY